MGQGIPSKPIVVVGVRGIKTVEISAAGEGDWPFGFYPVGGPDGRDLHGAADKLCCGWRNEPDDGSHDHPKSSLAAQRRTGTRWRGNVTGGKNNGPVISPARIDRLDADVIITALAVGEGTGLVISPVGGVEG